MLDDEINILFDVAGVVAIGIDTEILISSCLRSLKDKISNLKFIIQTSWIPDFITGKDDVGKTVEFLIRGGPHVHVRKARTVAERNVVAIRSDNALQATIGTRCLMHKSSKRSELAKGVDSVTLSIASILVHNNNGRTEVGRNQTSSSDKREILDDTFPNFSDIGLVKS